MEKIIEIIDKKELKDNIYKNVIQEKNIIIITQIISKISINNNHLI